MRTGVRDGDATDATEMKEGRNVIPGVSRAEFWFQFCPIFLVQSGTVRVTNKVSVSFLQWE